MGVGGVEVAVFAAGHSGAAAAQARSSHLAFLEFPEIPVGLHLADPHIRQAVLEHVAHPAVLHPRAGENIAGGENRQVAVAAVAAAVNHAFLHGFRDFESAGFVFIQGPQMVFFVKVGMAARRWYSRNFRSQSASSLR